MADVGAVALPDARVFCVRLKLLWLTLAQFHNYCEIEYLPVYTPSEAEKNDAHLYAANVRAVMAK